MSSTTYRHKKRGTVYSYICDATLQASGPVKDGDRMVVYAAEDGTRHVRKYDEFYDGRYEQLT